MANSSTPVVTASQLFKQALEDIQGKEVQNGYTLTYVWMANQLGHFTIGFAGTLLLVWGVQVLLAPCLGCSVSPFLATRETGGGLSDVRLQGAVCGWVIVVAVGHVLLWCAKEWWDYLRARNDAHGSAFDFKGIDVFLDAATAVGFIAIGIVVAFCSLLAWSLGLLAFVAGVLVALVPAHYWLSRKYCFQRAKIPYVFRLADFGGTFDPGLKGPPGAAVVDAFLHDPTKPRPRPRHLLIFGEAHTGRTELSTGILTEHCFDVKKGRYLTWTKFVENASMPPDQQEEEQSWPWQHSDIVVLDDVVSSVDGLALEAPADVAQQLAGLGQSTIDKLKDRQLVWVLGPADEKVRKEWRDALKGQFGDSDDDYCEVRLLAYNPRPRRKMISGFTGH